MNTYQCKDDIINADEKGQLLSEVKNISLWSNKLSYYAPKDDTGTGIRVMKVREDDDLDSLLDKVETATWLGVIQSSFTYFPYLRKEWKKNCDVEALLGVSLTGQMHNPSVLTSDALKALKSRVLRISRKASGILGTKMPAATTCVKPSGTVSQLVDSASGVHPRYSQYYIRRYRIAARDPLFALLKEAA